MDRVKDHTDLARDPRTGSIVNVNSLDYERYVASRAFKEQKANKELTMEDDLANLKGEINEIKSLLKELVNGK